jgi:hypothetical protein
MARRWLVAAVLLLAAGGCGDGTEAEPAKVPVPVTSSADPGPSRSAAGSRAAAAPARTAPPAPAAPVDRATPTVSPGFVAVVQRTMPDLVLDHRDDELLTLARQACAALAAGRSADAVVAEVRTFGTDRASARKLVRLAITTVCPGQDRRADEF